VVLERGEVANSWRHERWDSLRLLTPNWQARLPGYQYEGDDPDGFMTMPEVVAFIARYAHVSVAPVRTGTTVTSIDRSEDGYRVATTQGEWRCRTVVLASGACNAASVPAVHQAVPSSVTCVTALEYRNPNQLPEGGVLVVGASATGVQLADEIRRSGRPVTLSVGEHVRLPRMYRGRDVLWWMERSGVWNQRYDEIDDVTRARRLPSPQLVGTTERSTLDLNTLSAVGVELVGRLATVRDGKALFSGGLRNQFALADLKMERLLDTFDEHAGVVTLDAGSGERRDQDGSVVHRLPSGLQLAARARGGCEGASAARWRCAGCAGTLRAWTACTAPPQVHLHPRRRGRRARHRRASGGLPRGGRRGGRLAAGGSDDPRYQTGVVSGVSGRQPAARRSVASEVDSGGDPAGKCASTGPMTQ
jgi:putative flavoprotein involved in K+ transport